MSKMKDKVVLITGAVRGIGYGVACAFAEEGASLAITDLNEADLEVAKTKLQEKYPNTKVVAVLADGRDQAQVNHAVKVITDEYGRLDVLINNAQGSRNGMSIMEHTKEDFDLTFHSGVYASFYYMQACFPFLKEAQGSVINFASGAGISGKVGQAAYATNKEAIRCLTRVAANEWGEFGINVNNICPLATTPAFERWKTESPENYRAVIGTIPLRRFGDPKNDIGGVCVFLASEAASYITGTTIEAQGGISTRP